MSAHQLAKAAADDAEKKKYLATAMEKYLDVRSRLRRDSDDWWDVTIGAVEVQNLAGRHADNLMVVRRIIDIQPALGGSRIRKRYISVLEEMCSKLEGKAKKARAFGLLMEILTADLKQLRTDKKYDEILDVIRFIGTVAPDHGGPENVKKLRVFVVFAMKNAKGDDALLKKATELLDELKK